MTEPAGVGVIVPVRGRAPFLAEALESILRQEPPPADVVVVDDASPEAVVLPRGAHGRCRLVRRERSGGPAAARQTGLLVLDDHIRGCVLGTCGHDHGDREEVLEELSEAIARFTRSAG